MLRVVLSLTLLIATGIVGAYIGSSKKETKIIDHPQSPSPVIKPMAITTPEVHIKISKPSLSDISVLYFNVQVDETSTDLAIQLLHQLEKKNKPVYLVIDSPGGSVFAGARLISHMKGLNVAVNTVCESICASMGAQMFQAGKKRLMLDKSVLMFHPAAGGLQGTVPEMRSLLNLIDSYTQRFDMETAKRAGIPYEKFEIMVLNNLWIEAQDAIAMKLADGYVIIPPYQGNNQADFFNLQEELKIRKLTVHNGVDYKTKQLDNFQ